MLFNGAIHQKGKSYIQTLKEEIKSDVLEEHEYENQNEHNKKIFRIFGPSRFDSVNQIGKFFGIILLKK